MPRKKIQRKGVKQDQPVTQREFSRTMTALKHDLDRFATKEDLQRYATKEDLREFKDEIIYEFKAVAKNIHQDVAGANKDEISLIKDQQRHHSKRLAVVEKRLGIEG